MGLDVRGKISVSVKLSCQPVEGLNLSLMFTKYQKDMLQLTLCLYSEITSRYVPLLNKYINDNILLHLIYTI